jgi:transcriptional regulator with XRE-family HTH domain
MHTDNPNLYLGNKISETRKHMGLSQEALSDIAKVSLSTIQRIEKGMVNPRPYTLKVLADILNLNQSELLSPPADNSDLKTETQSLKWINFSALILVLVPLLNLTIPIILWRKYKKLLTGSELVKKIISFQLLWGILTLMISFLAVIITNIITGQAGEGLYISIISYLLSVIFNIFIIVQTAAKLNKGATNILSFVPSLI